jgi:hypothetical protein
MPKHNKNMAKVGMVFIILKKMDLGNSLWRATGLPQADGLELQQPYSIKDNVKDFTKQELHTNMDSL